MNKFIKISLLIIFTLLLIVPATTYAANEKKFTVVIDAGHGGKDTGAIDNGVMEKNINLKVARQLESLIKKRLKNTNVVMTRDNDTYLTLQQRADKANKAQGDIFISIHTNSVDKKNKNRSTVEGSSVYTLGLHKDENNLEVAMRENSVIELEKDYEQKYSGFDPMRDESYIIFEMAQKKNLSQSIRFAENIEKELVKSGRKDRGVHQAGFWVLWATSMPSVLIELDFICNPESAKYISSDKGAKELAEAIFNAVKQYESSWRKSMNGRGDLSDSYTDDSESILEDSYTVSVPVATARTRNHKSESKKPLSKSNKRRRRSASSKNLSAGVSYENGNMSLKTPSAEVSVSSTEPDQIVTASSETKDRKKSSSKKETAKDNKKDKKEKKNTSVKTKKEKKTDGHNGKINKIVTVYKIQVLASADLLNQSNARFCGLSPISTYKENNMYKYYYGESTDRAELEAVLSDVRKKIPDAFIVSSTKSVQVNK